jgi:hypothetical protein
MNRIVEAAAAPAIAIVMTTGANLRPASATAITMTHGRSDAVPATNGKGQTGMEANAIMIPVGPNAIATIENAIVRVETHSLATFTCRAGESASTFATVIASTHCAAPNREHSQPLVRSELSQVVISATTMGARLIHAPATFGTFVSNG